MSSDKLYMKVVSPTKGLFDGEIDHAVFPGVEGAFAIYRRHAPIVAALTEGEIKYYDTEGKVKSIRIVSGFLELHDNIITVATETQSENKV